MQLLSLVIASSIFFFQGVCKIVTDCTENAMSPRADESVRPLKQVRPDFEIFDGCLCKLVTKVVRPPQTMDDVENGLVTLSDKMTLCNRVLNDLKDLSDVLVVSPVFSPRNFVIICRI